MAEDANLTEFVGTSDDGQNGDDGEDQIDDGIDRTRGGDNRADTDQPSNENRSAVEQSTEADQGQDSVVPATTTYAFTADGARCDECDATVQRRWVGDGELVCVSCKNW